MMLGYWCHWGKTWQMCHSVCLCNVNNALSAGIEWTTLTPTKGAVGSFGDLCSLPLQALILG